ncbi:MAG: RimK-like protein [Pseudomonadota bacterium]|nr:RimK-like protein [Pseudomonadota bacterium]
MAIRNSERVLVAAVVAWSVRHGLDLQRLSHDWLLVLSDGTRRWPVLGYELGLNNSATARIANDKAATFDLLHGAGVPAIPHHLVLHPEMHVFTGGTGNWPRLKELFHASGRDVVLKPNEGTSGRGVIRVRDRLGLERAVQDLFATSRSIALSPFMALSAEERFVVLDGRVRLAYRKRTPAVTGDGVTPLRELVARRLSPESGPAIGEWLGEQPAGALDRVPASGESVSVGWRHNLGLGARSERLPADAANATLALRAAAAMGLRFGSVDIAVGDDGKAQVLEVNSGVMLEHHARQGAAERDEAHAIYADALDLLTGRRTG